MKAATAIEVESPAPLTGIDAMRAPFPETYIGKLPKPTTAQKDCLPADKVNCKVCGGWHHPRVVHLDYVGHAAITQRLLDADPMWSWEPIAFTAEGLPRFDDAGGLWIKLTVAGMTRFGYGDAGGKHGPNATKEAIGDAIRNAAMRFGAALELWHKGDWESDTFMPVQDDEPQQGSKETPKSKPELPACPDGKITLWFTKVEAGKAKAGDLMAFAKGRYTLSDAQEGRILTFVATHDKPTEPPIANEAPAPTAAPDQERQPGEEE